MFCSNCGKPMPEGGKSRANCGRWAWNDQHSDPAAVVPGMAKSIGFVRAYEG